MSDQDVKLAKQISASCRRIPEAHDSAAVDREIMNAVRDLIVQEASSKNVVLDVTDAQAIPVNGDSHMIYAPCSPASQAVYVDYSYSLKSIQRKPGERCSCCRRLGAPREELRLHTYATYEVGKLSGGIIG